MALEYACLQLHIAAGTELPRERILYAVTSYMDRMGMIPCGQENATRTICFAPSEAGGPSMTIVPTGWISRPSTG